MLKIHERPLAAFFARMKRILIMGSLMILVPMAGAVTQVHAAGVPQTLEEILQAIAVLQASVDALAPPAQSNVRSTPSIGFNPTQGVSCEVVNVDSTAHNVTIEHLEFDGSSAGISTFNIPASQNVQSIAATPPAGTRRHCRFTVNDGDRTTIRAAIIVRDQPLGNVSAALPAE